MFLGARRALAMRDPRSPIVQIFADGTDGFYFDFSKTDRTFQDASGQTLADDATESIGRALEHHSPPWGNKTYAEFRASQPELATNGSFDSATGWTLQPGASITGGQLVFAANAGAYTALAATAPVIAVTFDVVSMANRSSFTLRASDAASGTNDGAASAEITATGTYTVLLTRTNQTGFRFRWVETSAGSLVIDNVSVKEIPGNHGLQTTSLARPTRQAGGIARFDGTDDNLLTTFVPGTAMTLMVKVKGTSVNGKTFMGAYDGSINRSYIGTGLGGLLSLGVGGANVTSTQDIANTVGVAAGTYDGATVNVYWQGRIIKTEAQTGSPNTTVPFMIGCYNANATASTFFGGDIYHALAIKKALSSSQINAITNLWGTT